MSQYILELKEFLNNDVQSMEPKLWNAIQNIIEYKRSKYSRKLHDPTTGKGLIFDIEQAQDKYISTLCNFGMTKDEIIYILPDTPDTINEIKLLNLSTEQEQLITKLEYDMGHFLRRINKENALDVTKEGLARLLSIPLKIHKKKHGGAKPKSTPRKRKQGVKVKSKNVSTTLNEYIDVVEMPYIDWPSETAETTWLNFPRSKKMEIVYELWLNQHEVAYREFVKINKLVIEELFNNYIVISHKQKSVDAILEKNREQLEINNKWNKLKMYSNKETQCTGNPVFYGHQSQSDVWEYLKSESSEYFSLLSEYNSIKHILSKIESVTNILSNSESRQEYYNSLILSIDKFDAEIKGVARDDLKKWLYIQIKSFVELWTVYRKKHLNMTLEGPPGSGKTTIAEYMGPIFSKLGILLLGKYKVVSRSDLVGQYVGQTANKVKGVLNSMLESVLFIDEAYAVACNSPVAPNSIVKFDEFGIEGINEIVNFLDKHSGSIMVIAAGYEQDMQKCFFGANSGLERRFPKRYILQNLPSSDLENIFISKLLDTVNDININRSLNLSAQTCVHELFKATKDYWVNQAGDMVNLAEILAVTRASKGEPLSSDDIYKVVSEMFNRKDLSKMQSIPNEIEDAKIVNWTPTKVKEFIESQTYLNTRDKQSLLQMLTSGNRLDNVKLEDLMDLEPQARYNLIETLEEEKNKANTRIKTFFNDINQYTCGRGDSMVNNFIQQVQSPNTEIPKTNMLEQSLSEKPLQLFKTVREIPEIIPRLSYKQDKEPFNPVVVTPPTQRMLRSNN